MLFKREFYTFTICMLQMQHSLGCMCNATFHTMKQILAIQEHKDSSLKSNSRPTTREKRTYAFLGVARFLEENDEEQITVQDLIQRMEENLANIEHIYRL